MVNRYIRQEDGSYKRTPVTAPREEPSDRWVPFEEAQETHQRRQKHQQSAQQQTAPQQPFDLSGLLGDGGMVKRLLKALHLEHVDTGDLLLLLVLLLLFSEGEDTELLIALGLLLIL